MKFTIDKNKDSTVVTLTLIDGIPRVKRIPVKNNLYVRNNPPTKDKLLEVMERVCHDEQISEAAFLNQFQHSQSELITREAEDLIKCYLRIKNAIETMDIAEEIQLSNDSWHY
ncbi:hypothetical protein LZS85_18675 [Aliivibrio fischeri]|uniref:hypothetical protein n=1 Tax=Aliivibrio fischeri TaxID=668 RepID=UPI001F2060C6|nr:hypothetical protein [Aliivibrio fischeri]MCE7568159.1 hypothetical protein [Aliivibrio fischeri]